MGCSIWPPSYYLWCSKISDVLLYVKSTDSDPQSDVFYVVSIDDLIVYLMCTRCTGALSAIYRVDTTQDTSNRKSEKINKH